MSSSSYARMPNTNSNANANSISTTSSYPPMCVISSLDDIIAYIEISTIFPENLNNSNVVDIIITDNLASGRQLELLDILGSVSGIHMSLLMDHFATKGFIPMGYQQRHGYRIIRYIRHQQARQYQQQHHQQQLQQHQQQQLSTVPTTATAAAQAPQHAQLEQAQQQSLFQRSFQPAAANEAYPFFR